MSLPGIALAILCPPVLVILSVALLEALWFEGMVADEINAGPYGVFIRVLIPGTLVLSALIYFDCDIVGNNWRNAPAARLTHLFSALTTLMLLALIVTAQAASDDVFHALEYVVFLRRPLLVVNGLLLWFSARAISRSTARILMLALYVTVTVLVEFNCEGMSRGEEEGPFMVNSILVGLTLAIRLLTWGAKEFRIGLRSIDE